MKHFPKIPGIFFLVNCRIVNLRFFNSCYICTRPLCLWLSSDLRSGSWHILMSNIWSKYEFLLFYSHFWTGHESGTSIWTDGHRERRVEMKLCWHYIEILCISLSQIRLVESRVCGDAEGVGGWIGGLGVGHTSTNNEVLLFSFKGERV